MRRFGQILSVVIGIGMSVGLLAWMLPNTMERWFGETAVIVLQAIGLPFVFLLGALLNVALIALCLGVFFFAGAALLWLFPVKNVMAKKPRFTSDD